MQTQGVGLTTSRPPVAPFAVPPSAAAPDSLVKVEIIAPCPKPHRTVGFEAMLAQYDALADWKPETLARHRLFIEQKSSQGMGKVNQTD